MIIAFHLPRLTLGGVEMNAIRLSREFLKNGHTVIFLVHSFEGEYTDALPEGLRVVNLETKDIFTAIPKLTKWFRENPIDLLISSRDLYNAVLLWIKKRKKLPFHIMVTCHTNAIVEHERFKNKKRRIKTWTYMRMARYTYRWADSIVCVSGGAADATAEYAHVSRDRVDTVYNPIVDDGFAARAAEPLDDPEFRFDGPVVISAGRYCEQKNFPLLIESFALVHEKKPDAHLVIFGKGEEYDRMHSLIAEKQLEGTVILHDFVPNVLKYMTRSDLFVMSSDWEGFGNVLAEAMACGIPLVSTDCPSGPSEILDNGRYGILVPNYDRDGLADAILRQLDNPFPSREELVAASRRYTTARIAGGYLRVYEKREAEKKKENAKK